MSNAALYLNPEAYNTTGKTLMGRHSAGESFLKGYLHHAKVDRHYFWNVANRPQEKLTAFVRGMAEIRRPVTWIGRGERRRLAEAGAVHIPSPQIAQEAWARNASGDRRYSITGITHTTATHRIMDGVASLLTAPVQPWDALICTSRAVRQSVETQLEALTEHMRVRVGATSVPTPRLETIPLGIDTGAFAIDAAKRIDWRARLGIPEDEIVALYVGRFNLTSKMNPVPMAMALERAAQRSGRKLHWVLSGWAGDDAKGTEFHDATRGYCPSVAYHVVDGRKPDVRFSIWSVADLFISLSDNVQETFGLTPIEAMAAGLPCVVSDWDGYKDTVRHGRDGFRIPTYAPRPGLGTDLAYRHALSWDSYETYVGVASQFTAVDVDEAAQALVTLIDDPALRQRMGVAARTQAGKLFDWKAIIPQYQALWADLAERRNQGKDPVLTRNQRDNPWRLDPFRLFGAYPTEWPTATTRLALAEGVGPAEAAAMWDRPLVRFGGGLLLTTEEANAVVAALAERPQLAMSELLLRFPENRRFHVERGVCWLAKYGLVRIFGRSIGVPG